MEEVTGYQYHEYRIEYREGYTKKDKTALIRAVNAVIALKIFINEGYAGFKIVNVTEIPNSSKLQSEITDLKAELAECLKRKKAKAQKKA